MTTPERVITRALRNLKPGDDGCVLSTYSTGSHGYPQIGWWQDGRSVMRLVHRVVYEATKGPIPDGMTVDHMCKQRRCCNPDHLRLLTLEENSADSLSARRNREKTHCVHGHELSVDNTWLNKKGWRYCRTCSRERRRKAVQ